MTRAMHPSVRSTKSKGSLPSRYAQCCQEDMLLFVPLLLSCGSKPTSDLRHRSSQPISQKPQQSAQPSTHLTTMVSHAQLRLQANLLLRFTTAEQLVGIGLINAHTHVWPEIGNIASIGQTCWVCMHFWCLKQCCLAIRLVHRLFLERHCLPTASCIAEIAPATVFRPPHCQGHFRGNHISPALDVCDQN